MATKLEVLPGAKTRLYLDLTGTDFSTPTLVEVGWFAEGAVDENLEKADLTARIGRGLQMDAVVGFKPTLKGKLHKISTLATDFFESIRAKCREIASLGGQVILVEADGDIATAGTRYFRMWAVASSWSEARAEKGNVVADVEFTPGIGDSDGNTYTTGVVGT